MKSSGVPVVIARFPQDATWILLNPREEAVGVANQVANTLPVEAQAFPNAEGQVLVPPIDVEINGKTWKKIGYRRLLSTEDPPGKFRTVDAYTESCEF